MSIWGEKGCHGLMSGKRKTLVECVTNRRFLPNVNLLTDGYACEGVPIQGEGHFLGTIIPLKKQEKFRMLEIPDADRVREGECESGE